MQAPHVIRRAVAILLGLVLLAPLTCLADWPDISAKELKAMLDTGKPMLLINPLSDIEYSQGHIPGSVNIPLHTIMQSDRLPEDKQSLVITYCLSQQ